jgi:hypothetical protein
LLFGLAPALLFLGCDFGTNFLYPVLAHLGQALLLDQLIQQCGNSLCNFSIDVAAFTGAFNQGGSDTGVFGQQRGVAVGLTVDELL